MKTSRRPGTFRPSKTSIGPIPTRVEQEIAIADHGHGFVCAKLEPDGLFLRRGLEQLYDFADDLAQVGNTGRSCPVARLDLPEEQRLVLLLIAVEDFSYEQTARLLDVPLGTVMSRLSRGREHLSQYMNGDRVQGRSLPTTVK